MIILAHRGWWLRPEEKNSRAAIERAFEAGYGVETDIRDLDGEVVISHDPPRRGGLMTLQQLLVMFKAAGQPGLLALNVKADGLQRAVANALTTAGVERYFLFDMSVPDTLGYLRAGLTTFTRLSDHEPAPALLEQASGVWLDAFERDWFGASDVMPLVQRQKRVALVSPELHGRAHAPVWDRWRDEFPPDLIAKLLLCTDFPADAAAWLGAPAPGSDP